MVGLYQVSPHEGMMKPNGMMLGLPNLRKLKDRYRRVMGI
jgi:hypothetical protein